MLFKRAVITGYGVVTPIGYSVEEMMRALDAGACATRAMPPEWNRFGKLRCQVGSPVELRDPKAIPRALRRTMSPMSIFAVQASVQALKHAAIDPAGIPENPALRMHHGLHHRKLHLAHANLRNAFLRQRIRNARRLRILPLHLAHRRLERRAVSRRQRRRFRHVGGVRLGIAGRGRGIRPDSPGPAGCHALRRGRGTARNRRWIVRHPLCRFQQI